MKPFSCIIIFSLVLTIAGCQEISRRNPSSDGRAVHVSPSGFVGSTAPFTPEKNYVAMVLPFAPFSDLYLELLGKIPEKLTSRGEAHVTVLTPPEFEVLKTHLSIDDINEIAVSNKIQETNIEPVCLGKGETVIDGKHEQAYFVVVQAGGLLKIRRTIATEFVKRGGAQDAFAAEHFYPHVTIGFTKRDLFETDGVVKDSRSCVFALSPSTPM